MVNSYFLDIALSVFIYVFLLFLLLSVLDNTRGNAEDDDDQDGGIKIPGPPKLDLPPGVVLPDSPRSKSPTEDTLV
ncbi:MAG TPA: hypothetical protein ACFCUD_10780 [Cyclobacteriaceae bacterium]